MKLLKSKRIPAERIVPESEVRRLLALEPNSCHRVLCPTCCTWRGDEFPCGVHRRGETCRSRPAGMRC